MIALRACADCLARSERDQFRNHSRPTTVQLLKYMKTVLIAVLACGTLLGLYKEQLRQRFGAPVAETYLVRPGIEATATYGADGKITRLLIAPSSDRGFHRSRSVTLSRRAVDSVLDELVPPAQRGKFMGAEMLDVTCLPADDCAGSMTNYKKLSIYYNSSPESDQVPYAVVEWNR